MCSLESDDGVRNARELSDLKSEWCWANSTLHYLCNNAVSDEFPRLIFAICLTWRDTKNHILPFESDNISYVCLVYSGVSHGVM